MCALCAERCALNTESLCEWGIECEWEHLNSVCPEVPINGQKEMADASSTSLLGEEPKRAQKRRRKSDLMGNLE